MKGELGEYDPGNESMVISGSSLIEVPFPVGSFYQAITCGRIKILIIFII